MNGKTRTFICGCILLVSSISWAGIVELSVTTNKPVYELNEDIVVIIAAANNTSNPIKAMFPNSLEATYIMDGVYNSMWGKFAFHVITDILIMPGESHTWVRTHGAAERDYYPLILGNHEVSASIFFDPGPANISNSTTFQVVPEPTTLMVMGIGVLLTRQSVKRIYG